MRRAPLNNLGHGMPCPYILKPYVEHGEQAQRSNGGPMICFGPSAGEKCGYPATVAQLVEQRFRKPQVVGSTPSRGSSFP